MVDGGKLAVVKTPNAENPACTGAKPILTMDVWEHAYVSWGLRCAVAVLLRWALLLPCAARELLSCCAELYVALRYASRPPPVPSSAVPGRAEPPARLHQ